MFLEKNADVNIADKRGARPIHRAASKGIIATLRLLLTNGHGIDVNARDIYGYTAL
jgi:26S proteasome non-ATPase regulatory subunit 10